MINKLLFITILLTGASWANAQDPTQLEARMEETKSRLNLTEDQITQLKPILEAHFEAQMAILSKYDLGEQNRENRPDIETLRALRRELDENKTKTAASLKGILSSAQMAEFEEIQAERKKQFQERLLSKRAEDIGVQLGLTAEQVGQLTPVLADHSNAQMAVLEKHGIEIGNGGERNRMRLRALRALRNDMDEVSENTSKRLSGILSKAQLDQFELIQQAQRERLREIIRAGAQN